MKKVIFTEKAPAAIGPYSQAVEVNGMVFLSGQIPVDPATGEFVPGGVTEQTTQVFENIKNVLAEVGLTTANIVKTTVFLADISSSQTSFCQYILDILKNLNSLFSHSSRNKFTGSRINRNLT